MAMWNQVANLRNPLLPKEVANFPRFRILYVCVTFCASLTFLFTHKLAQLMVGRREWMGLHLGGKKKKNSANIYCLICA